MPTKPQEPKSLTFPAPHPSEFFLPDKKLKEAEELFDKTGDVRIAIHRNRIMVKCTVSNGTDQPADIQHLEPAAPPAPPDPPSGRVIGPEPPKLAGEAPRSGNKAILSLPPVSRIFIGLPVRPWGCNPKVHYSLFGNYRGALGPVSIAAGHNIEQARNEIATNFLEGSDCEWLVMFDDDCIAPFGHAGKFYELTGMRPSKVPEEFAGLRAVDVLTASEKHKIVGSVYIQRKPDGALVTRQGIKGTSKEDKEFCKRVLSKPQKKLEEVPWLGFGAIAIHRQVLIDIRQKFKLQKTTRGYDFFDFTAKQSEDVGFCYTAKECGHSSWLNCAVWCGHLGETSFNP